MYDKRAAYRRRLREKGIREVTVQLQTETIALLDRAQALGNYPTRGCAVEALLKQVLESSETKLTAA